jgi:hypothetical protein
VEVVGAVDYWCALIVRNVHFLDFGRLILLLILLDWLLVNF